MEPRVRLETNVDELNQPKAAPYRIQGRGVAEKERLRMDGKRRTPALPAVERGKGGASFPQDKIVC